MGQIDFTKWNKAFDKLRYKHDTWYIFRDWLDMTIDGFTIPGQTPLFQNHDKYTQEEYTYFCELGHAYFTIMNDALETTPYYDFLGEWWESDQNMTNKFKAQFFTPQAIVDLMTQLTVEDTDDSPRVMYDCCCGSSRFALAWHDMRPNDLYYLNDLDSFAVKMTLLNMVVHGLRGVVSYENTLSREIFDCWQVTPYLTRGFPYIVHWENNISGACSMFPHGTEIIKNPVSTIDSDNNKEIESIHPTNTTSKSLDRWIQ